MPRRYGTDGQRLWDSKAPGDFTEADIRKFMSNTETVLRKGQSEMDEHSNAVQEFSDQDEYRQYLTDAPIADFAKFAGIDIDEAVKRRVAEAVRVAEAAPPNMEVTARPITPVGNLLGFASVTFGGIKVDDFKIVE
jgi:hypothetical protein